MGSSGRRNGIRRVRSTKSTSAGPLVPDLRSGARGVPSAEAPWHQAQSRRYNTRPASPAGPAAWAAGTGGTEAWYGPGSPLVQAATARNTAPIATAATARASTRSGGAPTCFWGP